MLHVALVFIFIWIYSIVGVIMVDNITGHLNHDEYIIIKKYFFFFTISSVYSVYSLASFSLRGLSFSFEGVYTLHAGQGLLGVAVHNNKNNDGWLVGWSRIGGG